MKLKRIVVGEEQTNCYVLYEKGHALVIDPGDEGKRIKHFLKKNELVLDMILLTHAHIDHTQAVDYLYTLYAVPIYVHSKDREYYTNCKLEGAYVIQSPVNMYSENLNWQSYPIIIHSIPGHSEGSVLIQIENYSFSGDVLFKDGIGRYDLIGADKVTLMESLRFLLALGDNVSLYPGHDEVFTILKRRAQIRI